MTKRTPIVPPGRPEISRATAEAWMRTSKKAKLPLLIGRRGYYRDTMGEVGKNDINIYDDAITLLTAHKVLNFNANSDPSVRRKAIATLEPGLWKYKEGMHGISRPMKAAYKALVQAGPVTVSRWNAEKETGWFGINIHYGSYTKTSSAGCQTIYPTQWQEFMIEVRRAMKEAGVTTIQYLLLSRPDVTP